MLVVQVRAVAVNLVIFLAATVTVIIANVLILSNAPLSMAYFINSVSLLLIPIH